MLAPLLRAGAPLAVCLGTSALLASCTTDAPTANRDAPPNLSSASSAPSALPASSAGKVALCHRISPDVAILEVGAPALAAHLAHGDYVTTMLVSHDAVQTGGGVHFGSIGDALAAARAGRLARGELVRADCRITIVVSAGTYRGSAGPAAEGIEHFPFVVDVPDITLRGSLVMAIDANGRATGQGTTDAATTLQPAEPLPVVALSSTPISLPTPTRTVPPGMA